MMGIFKKIKTKVKKSFGGFARGWGDSPVPCSLTNQRVWDYYRTVSSLSTAIDLIANEAATVPLRLRKKDNGEFETENGAKRKGKDPLTFFKRPNCLQTYSEFIKELSTFYLAFGNTFVRLIGDVDKEPLEAYNVSPMDVTFSVDNIDSLPERFTEQFNNSTTIEYIRDEYLNFEKQHCFRYITTDGTKELVILKDVGGGFGNGGTATGGLGISKINSIMSEIEQLVKANDFNRSMLEKAAKLSLVIVQKDGIQQDQAEEFKSSVYNEWGGAENAGRIAYLSGDVEVIDFSKTQRDMDFLRLKQEMVKVVYQRYNVPLAFITEKALTFNNLLTSNFMLYENAVLPLVKKIMETFATYIMPRFPSARGDFIFWFNRRDIDALSMRQNERTKLLSEINVLTQNELRSELGFKEVPGGEVLPILKNLKLNHYNKNEISSILDDKKESIFDVD